MQTTLFELEAPIKRSLVPVLHPVDYLIDAELIASVGQTLFFDVECYPNYFLVAFKSEAGRVVLFEHSPAAVLNIPKLQWVLENFLLVGFNSRNYDLPLITFALRGVAPEVLHEASQYLTSGITTKEFLMAYGLELPKVNHIDIMEVAPLKGSLKVYAGRLHCPRMQDLPYDFTQPLSQEQANVVMHYCVNDLNNTKLLYDELQPQLELRKSMSAEYGQDLRSRSDAQVAEYIISAEVQKINGRYPKRPEIRPGTSYRYHVPKFIQYQTEGFKAMLDIVRKAEFEIGPSGAPLMPPELEGLEVRLGEGVYRMGIGGLHSSEQSVAYWADEHTLLIDRDVASYYPSVILNQELYPKHMGQAFLEVYSGIVRRRLEAKKTGDKVTAESLKITINGSFGKLGSMWSSLYSPDLLIQVTVTGQLCLLLLIEMIEMANIVQVSGDREIRCRVISANTDGVVILCPRAAQETLNEIIREWEAITGFQTEEGQYTGLFSRDVNNYIGLKDGEPPKLKGAFANPWAKPGRNVFKLYKNPTNSIVIEAVVAFLQDGTPLDKTIGECKDLPKFLTIRTVKGGAHQNGQWLGKVVRWYYSSDISDNLRYVNSGNQVPRSKGARPLMDLPAEFPTDINYAWYIAESLSMLVDIGYGSRLWASTCYKEPAIMRYLKAQFSKK